MAEEKNSFILYADYIHTVKKMSKEQAGDLFITILEYVNDLNPEPNDLVVSIVFETIKQRLKRDLKSWEDTKEAKSNSGIVGNLKRWHADLYQFYITKQITLERALEIANSRKLSPPDPPRSPPIANIAVSVSDSVNVSDSVSVTVNDRDNKGGNKKTVSSKPTPPKDFKTIASQSFEINSCPFGTEFKKNWLLLLQTKKWRTKDQSAINMSLKKLMDFDESFANVLVENTIAGGYQGVVFSDTDANYQKYLKSKNGNSSNTNDSKAESRDRMEQLARQILSADQAPIGY